jgi:CheY-like chemotaxis protein/anti-sigma regulatory factor (Ser/Thr protein kinase)
VETARPQVELRQHSLTVDLPEGPIWAEADPARLEQVAGNLLNNAAKYTDPGGDIRLTLSVVDTVAEIRVQDNGLGIAPQMLPRVFDLFTQEERSLDRSHGGLGIGLTLVKRLVEMHGGSVDVVSPGIGRGSTFTVRLPVLGSAVAAEEPSPAHSMRTWKILVVDDNVDAAKTIASLLEAAGHQVFLAYDGPTAIETARENRPDTILLDIGLPGMDGYEVARSLRQDAGLKEVRLIALTGYGQEEDRLTPRELGSTTIS